MAMVALVALASAASCQPGDGSRDAAVDGGGGDADADTELDGDRDDEPGDGGPGDPLAPGDVTVIDGPICVSREARLRLGPPAGAAEVMVSDVATFDEATWQEVEEEVTFRFLDTGYQMVFVRFRGDGGGESPIATAGCLVDPFWNAATASEGGAWKYSR